MSGKSAGELGDIKEFDDFVDQHPDVAELDVFIVDVNGHALGKRLRIAEGRRLYREGLAFSACAPFLDCRGRGQNPAGIGNSDGDPDGVVLPLAGMLRRVGWSRHPFTAVVRSTGGLAKRLVAMPGSRFVSGDGMRTRVLLDRFRPL